MFEDKFSTEKAKKILEEQLNKFAKMNKRFYLLRAVAFLSCELFLLMLLIFGLFITFKPALLIVVLFWVISVGILIISGYKLIKPVLQKYNKLQKALLVEQNFDDHANLVVNAIQLGENSTDEGNFSEIIANKITQDSARYLVEKNPQFKSKFCWSKVFKVFTVSATFMFSVVLLLIFLTQDFVNSFQHFFNPTEQVVTLDWEIKPGNVEIFKGDKVDISAVPNIMSSSGAAFIMDDMNIEAPEKRPMNFNGNSFIYSYKNVNTSFKYRVSSGVDKSEEYQVKVIELPEVTKLDLRLKYPEYTKKSDEIFEDFAGDITGLHGTSAILYLTCNQAVSRATLKLNSGETILFMRADKNNQKFIVTHFLTNDEKYTIELINSEDLKNRGFNERTIKVIPDLKPVIQILSPTKNSLDVAINSEIGVKLRVFDDYAVKSVIFVVKKNDEPEKEFEI